ncbi:MAG: nuclear transport factor 2 family protein [Gemmatimonadota bacterium]|nr:MAG: nuclear transport factor 2 family protein [Gemmatimonadota bacterium]
MVAIDIALEFVDRINRRDVGLLCELMTEDHRFIDSDGTVTVSDRESMRESWRSYYAMVPDYRIDVEETISSGDAVVLLGIASGTYTVDGELEPVNHWETPAAWKAVVRDNRVAEWRVWADLEPIRAVMRRLGTSD